MSWQNEINYALFIAFSDFLAYHTVSAVCIQDYLTEWKSQINTVRTCPVLYDQLGGTPKSEVGLLLYVCCFQPLQIKRKILNH